MNYKDEIRGYLLIVLVVSLISIVYIASSPGYTLVLSGKSFSISSLANNNSLRVQGLQDQDLTNDTRLLFVFPYRWTWTFWGEGMKSSFDIIFMDLDHGVGRVVDTREVLPCMKASPCLIITPSSPANYALETRAGFLESNNITIGSPARLTKN